jgi:hypothetical protein
VGLSRDLAAGRERPTKRLQDEAHWELVPEGLKPFIASCNLDDLESALRQRARLYWHPVVRAQLAHLVGLATDYREWDRVGWEWDPDKQTTPKQTTKARGRIRKLITAHAAAMEPGLRIEWQEHPKKSGRKAPARIQMDRGP